MEVQFSRSDANGVIIVTVTAKCGNGFYTKDFTWSDFQWFILGATSPFAVANLLRREGTKIKDIDPCEAERLDCLTTD